MRIGIAAFSLMMTIWFAADTKACDRPEALGTSRIIKIDTGAVAGFGKPFPAIPLSRGEIVLTFDDGPVPQSTSQILDVLARECVRATFFMIGKRAEANPQLVLRMRSDGHTVGSHSYSHRNLDGLPFEQAAEDIRRGYEAVEDAAGSNGKEDRPRLFRFPQYKSTPELVEFVRAHKGTIAGWDISSEDWRGEAPELTLQRVRRLLDRRDRGLLSLHDSQKNTVVLLPMILAEVRSRGLRVVHLVTE